MRIKSGKLLKKVLPWPGPNLRRALAGALLVLGLTVSPLASHSGTYEEPSRSQGVSNNQTPTSPIPPAPQPTPVSPGFSLQKVLGTHWHNRMVHFPIALGLAAFLLFLLALRWPTLWPGAEVLVLLGALASLPTVLLGELQKGPLLASGSSTLVQIHELLGWSVALGYWVWFGLLRWRRTRAWAWLFGLIVALQIGAVGFFGGLLAHSP